MKPEHVQRLRKIVSRPDYAMRRISLLQRRIDKHINNYIKRCDFSAIAQYIFEAEEKHLIKKKSWYINKMYLHD